MSSPNRGILSVVLTGVLSALSGGAALAAEKAKPMPNRFLFTNLGWVSSQPDQAYYPSDITDQLVRDWKDYAVYMKETGFVSISPWGFFGNTLPYPLGVDSKSAGTDVIRLPSEKLNQARRIIRNCQANDIAFYYGMCLYFAYWGDFLSQQPPEAASPHNKSVICPLYPGDPAQGTPGGIELMKQAIDFVVQVLPLDGITLESYHNGRCVCDSCVKRFPETDRGTAEFHRYANFPIFEHVRRKYPKLKLLFDPEGPLAVIHRIENLDILTETIKRVDYFVWCSATHSPQVMRKLAASAPKTRLMLRQEPWQSVPPRGPRDGWFFPNLVNPLGKMIHQRAKEIDWAGVAGCGNCKDNPGENVNLRFLAQMQMDPSRDPEAVAREILQKIYAPKNKEVLDQLYVVFSEPEVEFRKHWPTWFLHVDFMPKGYKFTVGQTVDMINSYQSALARLRAIKSQLGNQEEAGRLESSIVKWIGYIRDRLKKDYKYDMP